MNADLQRAERELAKGNPDEARVHAWNALAAIKPEELTRLREVADELDEKLLVGEIDRLGVPAEREQPLPSFRLRSFVFPVLVAIFLIAAHREHAHQRAAVRGSDTRRSIVRTSWTNSTANASASSRTRCR